MMLVSHLTNLTTITGGGVVVNRFSQLFLLALSQGKKLPEEWAESA